MKTKQKTPRTDALMKAMESFTTPQQRDVLRVAVSQLELECAGKDIQIAEGKQLIETMRPMFNIGVAFYNRGISNTRQRIRVKLSDIPKAEINVHADDDEIEVME